MLAPSLIDLVRRYDDEELGIHVWLNDHNPRTLLMDRVNHKTALDDAGLIPCRSLKHSSDVQFPHGALLHAELRVGSNESSQFHHSGSVGSGGIRVG